MAATSGKKYDPLMPPGGTLIKIGSLLVHYQEFASSDGHYFDKAVIDSLESDPDVRDWLEAMTKKGLLPVKRK